SFNGGFGFAPSPDYPLFRNGHTLGAYVDLNADGYPDFVTAYESDSHPNGVQKTFLSAPGFWHATTSGWVPNNAAGGNWTPPPILWDYRDNNVVQKGEFADLNGDGYPDLVRAYKPQNQPDVLETYLGSSSGFGPQQPTSGLTLPESMFNAYR